MKEQWVKIKKQASTLWQSTTKKQKTTFFSIAGVLLIGIIAFTLYTSMTKYVPLYSNLSVEEVGQIKEELDAQNVDYKIEEEGTSILVPEDQSEQLLVDLAGQGIPHSGNIDYSFFSENAAWGVTDDEFNMMKLDATQTELAHLIQGIEGIEKAEVMIHLPEETVFVNESEEEATASIVIHTGIGEEFKENQIDSLYHLVSKALPNLPEENIVITDQNFENYDRAAHSTGGSGGDYTDQQAIKQDIERDIQKRLQQMVGAIVGMDKVIVSVTADVDFTNEERIEELVEPVDVDNMEGIPVSVEELQETYKGNQAGGGVAGTGEEEVPNYPADDGDGDGDYETTKETVNNELNRIYKDIAESPYKLRNLGIQVAIDNVQDIEDEELILLTAQEEETVEEGVASILDSMVQTSIDEEYADVEAEDNVSIIFQTFHGREMIAEDEESKKASFVWLYIIGGVVLAALAVLFIFLIRSRKKETEETVDEVFEAPAEVPDPNVPEKSEREIQLDQLEKMAEHKPEDFAKILRSWLTDDQGGK